MSPLRTRFVQDMQLHGFSPQTQAAYVHAVRSLAKRCGKSPDLVSEEELRQYFLHLTLERKLARPTVTSALCGIKFFFQNTLQRNWRAFKLLRPITPVATGIVPSATGNKPNAGSKNTNNGSCPAAITC